MSHRLSLSRAAHLVGVHRRTLQKMIGEGRLATAERPTARMAIGIAVSTPCPSFRAMNAAAAENSTVIVSPKTIERRETSATDASAGTMGS